jgi:hypothetical protein
MAMVKRNSVKVGSKKRYNDKFKKDLSSVSSDNWKKITVGVIVGIAIIALTFFLFPAKGPVAGKAIAAPNTVIAGCGFTAPLLGETIDNPLYIPPVANFLTRTNPGAYPGGIVGNARALNTLNPGEYLFSPTNSIQNNPVLLVHRDAPNGNLLGEPFSVTIVGRPIAAYANSIFTEYHFLVDYDQNNFAFTGCQNLVGANPAAWQGLARSPNICINDPVTGMINIDVITPGAGVGNDYTGAAREYMRLNFRVIDKAGPLTNYPGAGNNGLIQLVNNPAETFIPPPTGQTDRVINNLLNAPSINFEFRQRWFRDADGDGAGGFYAPAANTFSELSGVSPASPNTANAQNLLLAPAQIATVVGGVFIAPNTQRFLEFPTDCADTGAAAATINAAANEICDRVDNNCDGNIDEGANVLPTCQNLNAYCGEHEACLRPGADATDDANYAYIVRCNILDLRPAPNGVGLLTDDETCQNRCTGVANNLDFCEAATGRCVASPTGGIGLCPIGISNDATPACGIDADGDGNPCESFETLRTCPDDCVFSADPVVNDCRLLGTSLLDPATATQGTAVTDCFISGTQVCSGVGNGDADGDGLCNLYENYLEALWRTAGTPDRSTITGFIPAFLNNNIDSDGDGVNDDVDFCPGTRLPLPTDSIQTGAIDFTGCYTADFVRNPINVPGTPTFIANGGNRPDGCYTSLEVAATNLQFMGGDGGSGAEILTSLQCRSSYLWRR